tara:strand:+ start:716 stop:988 length:273 start_codon:yes stop_codon:yes gene_type:complete
LRRVNGVVFDVKLTAHADTGGDNDDDARTASITSAGSATAGANQKAPSMLTRLFAHLFSKRTSASRLRVVDKEEVTERMFVTVMNTLKKD